MGTPRSRDGSNNLSTPSVIPGLPGSPVQIPQSCTTFSTN
jgi:hypothetical protein